mmetsp:Transcript_10489/g.24228  ORF Transcript_10489/g.24228 Transcript_10489/m.24228 type:complete len:345 (+) Transcript_10489:157-1191(+)
MTEHAGWNPLARVRDTCAAVDTTEAWVDTEAVKVFVATADCNAIVGAGEALASSGLTSFAGLIEFETVTDEVGFIAVTHALDFGSGFRSALHKFHGLGAWNTVKPGMVRLFAACPELSAKELSALGEDQLADIFLPGLADSSAAARASLAPFVKLLHRCTQDLARGLVERQFESMKDFVFATLARAPQAEPAAALVRELVVAFPVVFNDAHRYNGQDVFLYKKAQLVTGELFHRFRSEDERFNFADGNRLTCFCDNVIVATMRKTGCIRTTAELAKQIECGKDIPSGSAAEVALRAKSLTAVEQIASACQLAPCTVGNFLWAVLGKQPEFRAFPRHATPDTCFY